MRNKFNVNKKTEERFNTLTWIHKNIYMHNNRNNKLKRESIETTVKHRSELTVREVFSAASF